jgi:excisionase family DNA binding protein
MLRNPNNYLTSAQAAKLLGFSTDHIRNLINKGKLKASKFGRNWIIERKELLTVNRQRFSRARENMLDGNNKRKSKKHS